MQTDQGFYSKLNSIQCFSIIDCTITYRLIWKFAIFLSTVKLDFALNELFTFVKSSLLRSCGAGHLTYSTFLGQAKYSKGLTNIGEHFSPVNDKCPS